MEPQRVFLKDYKSPDFAVDHLDLDFDFQEDFCRARSTAKYRRLTKDTPLVLNGVGFQMISLKLNGQELASSSFEVNAETLTIHQTPESFELFVETRLEPAKNTSLEGVYRSNNCYVTQCEAQGFRKITYFLDRPDVMTRYTVRLEADRKTSPILLSNGNHVSSKDLGNGRHEARWEDPHKKPCYLFALFAGDLGVLKDTFQTASGRRVRLAIYAPEGKQDRCRHAMESLKKSMKWDEERFGREYDLDDYMIVAIDDFNAGAMENKGLNIFNSRLVLADTQTATDHDFHYIESVVAHEYFHNWTGNRVTLRDWFHLSLKEGLTVFRDQEFSGDLSDRGLQRIRDVDSLRERQFPEDSGPTAHAVRPDSCLAVDNFFTMTIYEKGAELIRMMQTTVGRKSFREGMDLYFERHDGQAVTTDDFAAAISAPSKSDFSQLKRWYDQAGTPRVAVQEKWDSSSQQYKLTLKQSCAPTPGQPEKKPFEIPIRLGLMDDEGHELPMDAEGIQTNSDGEALIALRNPEQTFVFKSLKSRPHLSLLRDFSAPVILDWERSDEDLLFLMAKDNDGFNRREAAQEAALRTLSGMIASLKAGKTANPNEKFLGAWSQALKANLDPAYHALLLSLPSDSMLLQMQPELDAVAFRESRRHLHLALALLNRDELLGIYRRYHGVDATKSDAKSAGHRSLKNLVLSLLAKTETKDILDLAWKQFTDAANMTDRVHALVVLAESKDPRREQALANFHQDWKSDAVVLNKWFSIQAATDSDDALKIVKDLCTHPDFNIGNPNNVYSLLRVYGNNLTTFHDPRNLGYSFYADRILEIDPKNPQVAARLCGAFNVVAKLPADLQTKMREEVARILASPTISKNTRELLEPVMKTKP